MKKRVTYLDVCRYFAIACVIMIHVLASFRYEYFGNSNGKYLFYTFLDSFTRTGIPIFLMLTGILMFQKKEEKSYKDYFIKRVLPLIIAYIGTSLIYYGYHVLSGDYPFHLYELIRKLTSSTIERPLWYLQSIILIYAFIPFLKRLVENLKPKELKTLIIVTTIFSSLMTSLSALSKITGYQILSSFTLSNLVCYLNFLWIGYYIEKEEIKINWKWIGVSILSLFAMTIATFILNRTEIDDVFLNATSIFVIAPSIVVYTFFKNHCKTLPKKLSIFLEKNYKTIFYIYLIHPLVMALLGKAFPVFIQRGSIGKEILCILGLWVGTLIISYVLAKIYLGIKKIIIKYFDQISSVLVKIFFVFFFLFLLLVLTNILVNPSKAIKMEYLPMMIGIVVIIGLFFLLKKYQDVWFQNKIVGVLIIALYFVLQLTFIHFFAVHPSWDFGTVYHNAVDFANGVTSSIGNSYLYTCDNNILYSVAMDILLKIAKLVGLKNYYFEIALAVNLIAIDLSLFMVAILLRKISKKLWKPYFAFCLLFSPLICYLPIFYTDTLTLPFVVIPLYFFYSYLYEKPKLHYIIISGLVAGIGGVAKPTVLIPVIAVGITMILQKEIRKQIPVFFVLLILSVTILTPFVGYKVFKNHFFDQKVLSDYRFPMKHYILIGMEGNGMYSDKGYYRITSVVGAKEKDKMLNREIKKRIKEMVEKKEVLSFYNNKINHTWIDGNFYSYGCLQAKPIHKEYIKYISTNNTLYWAIANSEWFLLILMMAVGVIFRKYLPEKLKSLQLILTISIFGLFLFLLIWEAQSRYLINFIPIFLLTGYLGVIGLRNFIKTKRGSQK